MVQVKIDMVEEEFALKKESKASLFSSYKRGKTF